MIELEHVSKTYFSRKSTVEAVSDVSLHVGKGQIFGIIGFSGAGKSTLVRLINLLERPTGGKVFVAGRNMTALSRKELLLARRTIGMIFQGFNLLMQSTALENVLFPLRIAKMPKEQARKKALGLLELVGLPEKADSYPSQLSGGQRQRVAIARALATDPQVLLCDEATSALDPTTTESILKLISDINIETGITVVMITHQLSVARRICTRSAVMDNSHIVEEGATEELFRNPKSDGAKKLLLSHASEDGEPAFRVDLGTDENAHSFVGDISIKAKMPIAVFYTGGGKALIIPQEGAYAHVREYLEQNSIEFREE